MNVDYLKLAIEEAEKSILCDEIPVGAVLVENNEILSIKHNTKEKNNCCIYHAEINAIIEGCAKKKNWRLDHCDLYVSFEPCPMCASAIRQSRIKNVYCALSNSNKENTKLVEKIFNNVDINPKVSFYNNLMPDDVKKNMKKFFENKRNKDKI